MFAIVREAGWPIWLLIATSFVALTLIVERLLALRPRRIAPPRLLEDVLALVQKRRITPEVVDKLEAHSPLGRVLAAGLRNRHRSHAALKDALEQAGASVAHGLGRYVGAIGTIAAIAPLMGLFGTVIGMIEIFGAYAPAGSDPAQLAHGISIALYNTGLGIFIAIPAMIFYRYFRARINDSLHDLEHAAVRLVDELQAE
ncbi:Biopolymer transport protein ExbB [Pigmentiphaga humi]|uniref:Biopolymer transport protein ExbB n=1 Tax=Pigmentiphaga humi TaxID=2478468 RepID=A0A3P4B5I9_9BURK|nr:MotA/TolQ/ExbB proton channel family protein [Pigmentiphaga humi]VCU71312.1 Biopolymer transport protein ExbB [Pigmentiphaga humi]